MSVKAQIKGTISNEKNEPVFGATVALKKGYLGTTSNTEGKYSLQIKEGTYTLVFRYIGYKTVEKEVTVTTGQQQTLDVQLEKSAITYPELVVEATRANDNTATAYDNIEKEELEKVNVGQDIPFLLNLSPSIVVSSDAGAGVGYTDMRIRGTDVTRINVTINGIPLNDAESQGVFWVNMPDFSSSLQSVQIQRGVGTSTNGSAAFGASVNLETESNSQDPYANVSASYGSFNTQKYNAEFGTGLINGKWAVDGRLSSISSDGYVDRASSNLRSYYISGGYFGEKTTVRAVHFSGQEETYQAWYGTPEAALTGNVDDKLEYALTEGLNEAQTQNLLNSGRTYNHYLYENEVDNYGQDHYQLHLTHSFNANWKGNLSGHYTKGQGYFEQYREDDDFSDYSLPNAIVGGDTLQSTDLIRRRWLDNDFYGLVANINYSSPNLQLNIGGAANTYSGDHFGEIIWSEIALNSEIRDRYYDNVGNKDEASLYTKATWFATPKLSFFGDLQYRYVMYETFGIDNDQRKIDIAKSWNFVNPKAGVTFYPNQRDRIFASIAVSNREPSRSDFLDAALTEPTPETLIDYELGIERSAANYKALLNAYFMDYQNQLVATGELNDVGALVKTNVPNSFRAGVELALAYQPLSWFGWEANYTFSQNKIEEFTEVVYDYTNGFEVVLIEHQNTDIALSPNHIAKSQLKFFPFDNAEVAFITSYVGKQYLDNTSNENRTIDPYLVNDLRINYSLKLKAVKEIQFNLLVNNLFNELYAARGYTYTYIFGEQYTRNHYYPQATRNFLAGVTVKF